MGRLWNVIVGLDQTINAADGGSPDETISSRAYKEALAGKRWGIIKEAAINLLFACFGVRDHCRKSVECDE